MVNGYTSYLPESRGRFAHSVRGFPDLESHEAMNRYAVRWVVVPLALLRRGEGARPEPSRWRPAYREPERGVAIYQVLPEPERRR